MLLIAHSQVSTFRKQKKSVFSNMIGREEVLHFQEDWHIIVVANRIDKII